MPAMLNIIVIVCVVIMILIVALIGYILYLYKNDPDSKSKKKEKQQIVPKIKTKKEEVLCQEWEKTLIIDIAKERLNRTMLSPTNKRLDENELDILAKIIEKKNEIVGWASIMEITQNEKTYGILNVAILDYLYKNVPKKEKENEVVKTAYLLDMINDGIIKNNSYQDYLPNNLDITATLIKLLNNDLEEENRTNKLNSQSVKRACIDLVSNGGYKDLNWAARQVICRIILDVLGDVIYKYENTSKILSIESKIYIRLFAMVLSNKTYLEIVDELAPKTEISNIPE